MSNYCPRCLGVATGSAASISTPRGLAAWAQGWCHTHGGVTDVWQLWGAFLGPLCSRRAFEIRRFPSLVPTLSWCPAWPLWTCAWAGLSWPWLLLLDLLCGRGLCLAACCGHRLPLPPARSGCSWQQTFLSGLAGNSANARFHQFVFTEDRVNFTDPAACEMMFTQIW